MAKTPKHALGRGLEALLGGEQLKAPDPGDQVLSIRLQDIDVNRAQPRRTFDEEGLRELSESIRSVGVVQPILVARSGARYSIIAGEGRGALPRPAAGGPCRNPRHRPGLRRQEPPGNRADRKFAARRA